MLNNASGFRKVYIAAGYTDLRRGIDGLASIVKFNFQLEPYEKDILFLFCGRRSDRIKGLIWEGDRFLPPLQKAGAWRFQLAPYKRRGTGDHAGTISGIDERGWRLSPDTRSRKCILRISCKALCKTEKIKNLFAFAVQDRLEVIHSRALLHSFNHGVLTGSKLPCG